MEDKEQEEEENVLKEGEEQTTQAALVDQVNLDEWILSEDKSIFSIVCSFDDVLCFDFPFCRFVVLFFVTVSEG